MTRPMGRPPTLLEEKYRLGNPGKRALPDRDSLTVLAAADGGPPEPPRPLRETGRAFWDRVWSAGANWLAKNIDREAVLIICEQLDERQLLRASVFRDADWRERAALRALDSQITTGLALLGFNPVDRARLGVAEVRSESRIDQLRRERAQ